MSVKSTSPPVTPSTPPPPEPTFKVTLPTPSSFSSRRARSQSSDPSSPASNEATPSKATAKGHTRSVSFSVETPESPESPDVERLSRVVSSDDGQRQLYRIPQRSRPGSVSAPSTAPLLASPPSLRRLNAPKPLDLPSRPVSTGRPSLLSPFSRGPVTAPGSRFASTAAERGISIAPALARGARHSTSAATGGSIWSAGLGGSHDTSGWISPALGSARSTGTGTARQRGLTVAVLKDSKEMIVGDVPVTPGLSTSGGPKSAGLAASAPFKGSPILEEKEDGSEASPRIKKPEVVILCRYYHTPGLTCTSRPCRFVHNLEGIASPRPVDEYEMKSPNNDPTAGTFARAQMQAQAKVLKVDDLVNNGATPGETVLLADEGGKEVRGTVYLMSGGGKGPAGKSRAKFKTVKCKDYAEGYCVYGDYCSFIHDEKVSEVKGEDQPSTPLAENKGQLVDTSGSSPSSRRWSTGSALAKPSLDAWSKALPRAVLVPSVKVNIATSAADKPKNALSAFAAPYSTRPMTVNDEGELVPKVTEELDRGPIGATTLYKARSSVHPPQKTKQPPASLKKVMIVEPTAKSSDTTPNSALLAPPPSALSMFGTESDPATPWDPALLSRMSEDESSHEEPTDHFEHEQHEPTVTTPSSPPLVHGHPWLAPAYPWGMPMTPLSPLDQNDPLAQIPGGPGVMWTPAGWAVQDAAMKLSLRAAEVKSHNAKSKMRSKGYWRTKSCKLFEQGHCPHGDACTYLHTTPLAGSKPRDRPAAAKNKVLPCKFFNSARGCTSGDDCDFLHKLVLPDSVPMIAKPRPWRTRPCRHYQLGRCNLGDACHFAHVVDPTHVVLDHTSSDKMCWYWERHGACSKGVECQFRHDPRLGHDQRLTEKDLSRAFEAMRSRVERQEESDGEDDDVEIVTATQSSFSPAQSVRA